MTKIFRTTLLATLLGSSFSTTKAALIWHSALDGNATAIVGGAATASGNPTPTADINGQAGGAVLFDGSSFFQTPQFSGLTAGSISIWVRRDGGTGGEQGIAGLGESGGGSAVYYSLQDASDGDVRVDLDDGSARRDVRSDSPLSDGIWTHVTTTFTTGGNLRVYIDGVDQTGDSQNIPGGTTYNFTSSGIIGSERSGERFWVGALDDVRFYDNELTAGEVSTLFNDGPLSIPEPSTTMFLITGAASILLTRRRASYSCGRP